MRLYHGSNVAISEVDFGKCRPFKDFGQGFYLTPMLHHAQNLAIQRKDVYGGESIINEFEFDSDAANQAPDIKIKVFEKPSEEWVRFVMKNRDELATHPVHDYDIVVGPIADDKVAASIKLFQRDFIDMQALLKRLEYRELSIQYFFHNKKSLRFLTKL